MTSEREKQLEAALTQANDLIRSFNAICSRRGERTNWGGISVQVRQVLGDQHRLMHPEQYVDSPRA